MKKNQGKLERIINHFELIKKLLVSLLIIVLSFILLIFLLKNSFKRQLIIKPFRISSSLQKEGYIEEILTTLFIDKMKEMQQIGASFYHKNKVILPSWDNEVDEVNVAFNNSIFSDVKSMLEYFGSKNSQYGNGQIIKVDDKYMMQFSINNHSITILNKQTLNDLLSSAAEYTLKYTDPYNLATYYLKENRLDDCSQIIQQILNDDEKENDGLAMNLRGVVYLQRKDTVTAKIIFLQVLKIAKSPWLTDNNLGLIYFHEKNFDSARIMFNEGIRENRYVYPLYVNYGNLLYQLYADNHNPMTLDSAIKNYESAIELNKNEESLYRAILPPLSDKKDQKTFDHYSRKLIEMNESNYLNYFTIGGLEKKINNLKANSFFQQAIERCPDSIIKKQISHSIIK